jgi:hypothetical protein
VNQDEANEHIYGILFIYDIKEHVIFLWYFSKIDNNENERALVSC